MKDYISQADMLRTWSANEVRVQPHLVIGQLQSAALTIERLGAEVDRLNMENFWLSRPAEIPSHGPNGGRMVELPPVEVGDIVWGIRFTHRIRPDIAQGDVTKIAYDGKDFYIHARATSFIGRYGETVFKTREEADAARNRLVAEGEQRKEEAND